MASTTSSRPGAAEIANKRNADCAEGILNAPDDSFDPQTDQVPPPQFRRR